MVAHGPLVPGRGPSALGSPRLTARGYGGGRALPV